LNDERRPRRGILCDWHIDVRLGIEFIWTLKNLRDNADDLANGKRSAAAVHASNHDTGADRIAAEQMETNERFVDDADGGAGRDVTAIEMAAEK
jgi:hypothetical protein